MLDPALPIEQLITHPPLPVFEVLSPEDTLQRLKQKLEDCHRMGIPVVSVIDPADGSYSPYQDQQLVRTMTFSFIGKNIHFNLDEMRALLD